MIYRQFLGMWSKIREMLGNSSKFMGGKLRASCVSCFFFLHCNHPLCLLMGTRNAWIQYKTIQNPFVSWGKCGGKALPTFYAIHNRATSRRTIGPIFLERSSPVGSPLLSQIIGIRASTQMFVGSIPCFLCFFLVNKPMFCLVTKSPVPTFVAKHSLLVAGYLSRSSWPIQQRIISKKT